MSRSADRPAQPSRRRLPGALVLALLLAGVLVSGASAPEPLRAQSILAAEGLGFPVDPVAARARGMGSLGVGLLGSALLPGDPALSRALPVPLITATYQPSRSTYTLGEGEREVSASRFPLLGVAYPVTGLGGTATLTFGSFLDLEWRTDKARTLTLGEQTLDVTDTFRSAGGVSTVRIGWTHGLHETLAVAVSAGTYLGELRRVFTRRFSGAPRDAPVEPYQVSEAWHFTGPNARVAATWDPVELIRIGASATWSGTLHADAAEGSEASDGEFDLPSEYRFGASASLSPRLFVNAGVSYADWTATSDDLSRSSAVGSVWSYGGGVEWEGPELMERSFPVRLGYRHSDLPFRFDGADPVESAFALGLGMNLLQTEDLPLAVIDLAVELGSREAGALSEDFTRATVSVRVAGN